LTISKLSVFSIAKSKNIVVFSSTFVFDSFGLFYGNFCIDLYSVDSDEVMKRGDEALNASSLHCYDFLLSVNRFIIVNFYGKILFNASSPLLFKRNSSPNGSSPLLLKVNLPTSAVNAVMFLSWVDQCPHNWR
jgi:hypothetical protein